MSSFRVTGCLVWAAMFFAVAISDGGLFSVLPALAAGMLILTLGMPEALRRGLAKCASRTKVVGMTIAAVLLTGMLTAAIVAAVQGNVVPDGLLMGLNIPRAATGLLSGGLLAGIRCMEEFFHADGDGLSAAMLDVLAAVSVCAVALLDGVDAAVLVPVLAGILLLGVIIALITGRKHARAGEKLSLELVPLLKEIPAALLRVGPYPVIAAAVMIFENETGMLMPAAGLLAVELGRSAFRRDEREATGYVLTVTHLAVIAAAGAAACRVLGIELLPDAFLYAAAGVLMLLYAPLNGRMLLSGALLLAAAAASLLLSGTAASIAVGALTLVSALLMIPEWRELFRIQKVKRIRARAMKNRKPR